jgi:hypothetical protein
MDLLHLKLSKYYIPYGFTLDFLKKSVHSILEGAITFQPPEKGQICPFESPLGLGLSSLSHPLPIGPVCNMDLW